MIEHIPDYSGVGIYALRDNTGRVYIGSAKNVRKRIEQHNKLARLGGESRALQAAFDSGVVFTASIVERLPPSTNTYQLREAEARCIAQASARGELYNHDIVSTRIWKNHVSREKFLQPLRPDLVRLEEGEGL